MSDSSDATWYARCCVSLEDRPKVRGALLAWGGMMKQRAQDFGGLTLAVGYSNECSCKGAKQMPFTLAIKLASPVHTRQSRIASDTPSVP